MTFVFAGQKIPIHPLDTTIDLNLTNTSGDEICVGTVSTRNPPRLATAHRHRSINPSAPRSTTITTSSSECPSVCTPYSLPLSLLIAFAYSSKRLYAHRLWRLRRRHLQHR